MNTLLFKEYELWFTADMHFMHENVIKYCDRPFANAREMDEALIKNWNSVVKKDDTVIVAGDFCFGGRNNWRHFLYRLNGNIILVQGNHDKDKHIPTDYFTLGVNWFDQLMIEVKDSEIGSQRIMINHYAMLVWRDSHKGSWNVYGHSHGVLERKGRHSHLLSPNQYDVGVDCNNYTPVSYQKFKEIITKQNLKK